MRRVTIAAVLLLTLVLAAPAGAGLSPLERRQQAQIKTLQKQVKQLRKDVNLALNIAALGALAAGCNAAATADALQGTWKAIEAHEGTGTSMFGAQQQVNDFTVCQQGLRINRVPSQPTVGVFQSILNLFGPA